MAAKKNTTTTDTTTTENPAGKRRALRASLGVILAAVIALGWVACLSYDPADKPGTTVYPANEQPANIAGAAGAAFSHMAFHWIGSGIWVLLIFGSVVAIMSIIFRPLKDLWLRLIGVLLVMAAVSTLAFLAAPHSNDAAITGSGGVLGVGTGLLLGKHFGSFSWAIAFAFMVIGLILAADEIMFKLPALLAGAWKRRKALADLVATNNQQPAATTSKAAAADAAQAASRPKLKVKKPEKPASEAPQEPVEAETPEKRVSIMQAAEAEKQKKAQAAAAKADQAKAAKNTETTDDKPTVSGARAMLGGLLGAKDPAPKPAVTQPAPRPQPVKKAVAVPSKKSGEPASEGEYPLPDMNMLIEAEKGYIESQQVQVELKRSVLQQTLNDFNVDAEVIGHMTGPVITMFELALAPGVKVSRIASLSGDIARSLAAPSVRIVSPIPGKDTIGIEVPNAQKETVRLKQLMELAPKVAEKFNLPLYLGKDASGDPIVADLATMPHMLIAGTTGSGKSVCINTIILSLLMTRRPEDVRLIMVDPKMVEMAAFERIGHLLCPIVNDMHKAESILEWAATQMDERYELLKEAGVRNISGYNAMGAEKLYRRFGAETDEEKAAIQTRLPYTVVIVDELADLIMTSSKEVEEHIIRIAQKARAVGIHLILATQRPSANVVTGLIKSNMPCRVSFQVASGQESRIVLDQKGAELLLGRGDMLFLRPGTSSLVRAQGTYLDDSEIHDVVDYINSQRSQSFNQELVAIKPAGFDSDGAGERDDLFDKAVEIILSVQRGSVSLLQRRLSIGYTRASRIVDQMADAGILGDYKGSQARECLMTLEDWQMLQASIAADRSGANSLNGTPTSD